MDERGEPGFTRPGEDFAFGGNEYLKRHKVVTVLLQPQPLVTGQKVNVAITMEATNCLLKCREPLPTLGTMPGCRLPSLNRSLFQNSPHPCDGGIDIPMKSLFPFISKTNSLAQPINLVNSLRISLEFQSHQWPFWVLCKLRFCPKALCSLVCVCPVNYQES